MKAFASFTRVFTGCWLVLAVSPVVRGADVLPDVKHRFSQVETSEIPDFQKHVVPMLGRLGCNGRACHGAFQGQGGFRLSLFGYDFELDHEQLSERIDTETPSDSYALQKGTLLEAHEGGKRMDVGSWEYNVFERWIAAGAKPIETPRKLLSLDVTPREIQFTAKEQTQPLQVVAVWEDGTREDVTVLCRYTTNDDQICLIDENGVVTSGEVGDAHVVVAYDKAVVPIPVLRPVSDQIGDNYPQLAGRTEVDQLVLNKLRKLGIIPSEVCSDEDFLRRVSLDITGTLPTAAAVREFLADSTPDKRARKVDELLETPAYAAWWTVQLSDWTGCTDQALNNVNPAARQRGSQDWYDWIYKRVSENMPYDTLVENIVVANSRLPGESYLEYCERMSNYARDKNASFADQEGLIYFWGRANFRTTEDRAIGFAYTFMGTRIQCAQCHKHPFDVWTQQDFKEFEGFFSRVNFARNGSDRQAYQKLVNVLELQGLNGNDQRRAIDRAIRDGKTIPFPELVINPPRTTPTRGRQPARGGQSTQMARLLGEQTVDLNSIADPRTALMDWLRQSPTQLFAKAYVNRVWANYFNQGIVEPTDDLSLGNPPSNAELLDYLAQGFIDSGYDMKWVHRTICLSDTYQRSWRPNESNTHDERNFSRAVPRRLPAEVAYDALTLATINDQRAANFHQELNGRAVTRSSPPRNATAGPDYALAVFGRSTRESNCDCDRSAEASLLQTLYVRNDQEALALLNSRTSWLASLTGQNQASDREQARIDRLKAAAERRFQTAMRDLVQAKKAGEAEAIAAAEKQVSAAEVELDSFAAPKADATRSPEKLIEEAYLRTVSRFPSEQEQSIALQHLQSSTDLSAGLQDLLWALVNTKEFLVNH